MISIPIKRAACLVLSLACAAAHASAIDEAHRDKAERMIDMAVAYLHAQQDESGGWAVQKDGPNLPAITGLVLTGLLMDPDVSGNDPAVQRAAAFIVSYQQPDGGIYDRILPSYNTAICVSALARLEGQKEAATRAVAFLRTLQYSEDANPDAVGGVTMRVGPEHPFYGGVGYGRHGRPDNSNLGFFLQAMHDAEIPSDDPAFQRALVFLKRTQMHERVSDMDYADGSRQGGFIYATGPDGEHPGDGESKAGMIWETTDDGTRVSRLRCYGSMTYMGFKSFAYAGLGRDDEAVTLARKWIGEHYTLAENPGLGTEGLYYYLMVFARANAAWGEPTITVTREDATESRDWANDLIDRLAALQNADGSFKSIDDRWMENNPVLITAYALIALEEARGSGHEVGGE